MQQTTSRTPLGDRSGSLRSLTPLAFVAVLMCTGSAARAQTPADNGVRSHDGLWQSTTVADLARTPRRADIDGVHAVVQLNRRALDTLLERAPLENATSRTAAPVVTLPLPDGRFSRFRVEESPILAPELAATFPDVHTYRGAGLDDPTATARIDLTGDGVHAQIIAAGGTVYVDPYAPGDPLQYVSYNKASLHRSGTALAETLLDGQERQPRVLEESSLTNGTTLRTYRLAVAATGEYTTAAGGTIPAAVSRITTTMNRVNGIYERELAMRFTVVLGTVADTTALIYTDGGTDPYTNGSAVSLRFENVSNLDAVLGAGSYDVGHVLATVADGLAYIGSACSATKGGGVSGSPTPTGDAFDVDLVTHELAHQFNGNHAFNSNVGACAAPSRWFPSAFEVGSGSTILAYAGQCADENLQANNHDMFGFESLNEITAFITSGGGAACGTSSATGNTAPSVSAAGASYTIPRLTPFVLTAAGSDPNGDTVTYSWEEHDLGTESTGGSTAATDDGTRPLFRSYPPTTAPTRTFPNLTYILNNANVPPLTYTCGGSTCLTGEVLPSTTRTMTFMVTARDNRVGGGAVNSAQTQVAVNSAVGPFAVTAPNTGLSWMGGLPYSVNWSVNGANALAANVRILLSTDGGLTFPTTLAASTPNDGVQLVTLPNTPTASARIKVEALGNIFFDVSDSDFTIVPAAAPSAFTKTSPTSGTTGAALTLTLSWSSTFGAAGYEYCVDTSANATCNGSWTSAGTASSTLLTTLRPSTTYSWQVRAVNGIANTEADGTWWTFTTQAPTNPVADLAIDFGAPGLWAYYDGGMAPAWRALHNLSPTRLARGDLDGNGLTDLVMTFAGAGTWAFMNNTSYVQLHPFDAGLIETGDVNGNGSDDLIVTFAGYGVWIRFDNGAWMQLHNQVPTVMAVGNIDGVAGGPADVVLSFGPSGLWAWTNNSAWSQLHPLPVTDAKIGDLDGNGVGDLIAEFSGYGEYVLYNSTTWAFLHPAAAAGYVTGNIDGDVDGRADVVVNFPGSGVWAFMNNSSWVLLHGLNTSLLETGDIDGNGVTDVLLSFPGLGLWSLRNNTTWSQIHNLNPEVVVSGRMNGS